ncbi:MAG: hypothetical protein DI537_30760 [Stutzerimonas stutzeri]|nr:MAG: hypothetical protein DI537_30760 [Stutzerimonas stutzeri]
MKRFSSLPDLDEAIQHYFDVLYGCDLEKFDRVFHPACNLYSPGDAEVAVVTLSSYRQIVAGRTPPSRSGYQREEQVDAVISASADVAMVFLSSRVGERRFKDLLSFVRAPDGWKIVAKTYALRDTA